MMARLSCALYRRMLHLYPSDFRAEFGDLMLLVFEESCRDTRGVGGWFGLWRRTLLDLVKTVYTERRTNLMTKKINNYVVNSTLGDGSAAVIYRAYDAKRAMQVALKVLHKEGEAEFLKHFEREGNVHPTFDHPNIPRCFGYEGDGENKVIVMEYINGKSLLEILQERNTPFAPEQVVKWAAIACDVLTYLHNEGYVYRDMKPGNLMLTADGDLYLIDYGITVNDTGDGVAIGTEGYAPPEQYKGTISHQSDIYALGASLHHLLTNRDPRYHDAHSFKDAPPRMYNPAISKELEQAIMKALADNPQQRYTSAEDFKTALLAAQ